MFLLALIFAKPCYGISQGEIVTKDSRRSFPFHVQLAFQQEEGEEIVKPLCGGSLIAERFICSFFRTEILSYLITYNKKYGLFYHFAHSSNLDANAHWLRSVPEKAIFRRCYTTVCFQVFGGKHF